MKGFKNSLYRESHRSGNLKTLKELATARNMASNMHHQNNKLSEGLPWSDHQMDNTQNINGGITLDSNLRHIKVENNPYKRSQNSKSRVCVTSDGGNGLNHISDIHPHSKDQSEDVNGTLINSIINLFPNKFQSNKGSSLRQNDNGNPGSSFSCTSRASLSKRELQEKLEMIQRK